MCIFIFQSFLQSASYGITKARQSVLNSDEKTAACLSDITRRSSPPESLENLSILPFVISTQHILNIRSKLDPQVLVKIGFKCIHSFISKDDVAHFSESSDQSILSFWEFSGTIRAWILPVLLEGVITIPTGLF